MITPRQTTPAPGRQLLDFLVHLRVHYQLFILSGGFLLGGYLSPSLEWSAFLLQFMNVHLLLFGGATVYNSYWDKDEGPVGGLRHPPPLQWWMWPASLLLQLVGLLVALQAGLRFALAYMVSMLLFWLYSSPLFRWKGRPLRSLLAIGISTGTNSLLMGYLAGGHRAIPATVWVAALGVGLVILSLYPVSQVFQIDEDQARGDRTFANRFGFEGVLWFFRVAFPVGVGLLGLAIGARAWWVGAGFVLVGFLTGYLVNRQLTGLMGQPDEYERVMRIKYGTSMAFVIFILGLLILRHGF